MTKPIQPKSKAVSRKMRSPVTSTNRKGSPKVAPNPPKPQSISTNKLNFDWKQMHKVFDEIQGGQPLKTKFNFTKTEVLLIANHYK